LSVRNLTGQTRIPDAGGNIQVNGTTEFLFTPVLSGDWEFVTSNNGTSDPLLEIFDMTGRLLADDDDSGEGYNAHITIHLDAGTTYMINARFWGSGSGSYTLTVSNTSSANVIPSGGGSVRVTEATDFVFTPDRSGTWEFRTSDNGNSDPMLYLYVLHGNLVAEDDDSGGNLNALITANLDAGESYVINARFWADGGGSYLLTVTRR